MVFTTLLHGFAPRLGVFVMNVRISPHVITKMLYSCGQILTLFKTIVLVLIVISGKASTLVTSVI